MRQSLQYGSTTTAGHQMRNENNRRVGPTADAIPLPQTTQCQTSRKWSFRNLDDTEVQYDLRIPHISI